MSFRTTNVANQNPTTGHAPNGRLARVLATGMQAVGAKTTGMNIVADDDDDDEIVYHLGKRTIKHMPRFLEVFSYAIMEASPGEEGDEGPNELYLFSLLDSEGSLDINRIMELLKDEKNHMKIMCALYAATIYDLDFGQASKWTEAAGWIDDDDKREFYRIYALLSKWMDKAREVEMVE